MKIQRPRVRGLRRHWVPASLAAIVILTVGFFVVQSRALPGLGLVHEPVQGVDPRRASQP
jgi:hypothetical protein